MANREEMKAVPVNNLSSMQQLVKRLQGSDVKVIHYNRGKEMVDCGKITAVYNNLFIFEFDKNGSHFKNTFTYNDLIANKIGLTQA